MKLKLIIISIGLSSLLQASECKIDYMGTLDKDNILSYRVNNTSLVVTLDKGIVYRIFAYVNGDKKNTFKEAFIFSSKMCFGSGMKKCVALHSQENDVLVETFLENSFCKE